MHMTPYHFFAFRIIFACYLVIHFFYLAPTVGLPDTHSNPSYDFFPNLLNVFQTPLAIKIFTYLLMGLSFSFGLGFFRRICALLLWYGWACLLNGHIFIASPGTPFIGFLLLICAIIPEKEPLRLSNTAFNSSAWGLPPVLFYGSWALIAMGYLFSGLHKLGASSWLDGTALHHVLTSPLARDNFVVKFLLTLPLSFFKALAYGVTFLELAFALLCLFKKTRLWAWGLMLLIHFGALSVVHFTNLSFGFLMIHFFVIDSNWIFVKKSKEKPILFFDGVCHLCNSFIHFVVSENQHKQVYIAALQGKTASIKLLKNTPKKLESIIFYKDKKQSIKSTAVIKIALSLGGLWNIALLAYLIPKLLRDKIYDWIATNRYSLFGKRNSCRLPTKEEQSYFLE